MLCNIFIFVMRKIGSIGGFILGVLLVAIVVQAQVVKQVPFKVLTGVFPASLIFIGTIQAGSTLKATVKTSKPFNLDFRITQGTIFSVSSIGSSTQIDPLTDTITIRIPSRDTYWVNIDSSGYHFIDCEIKVEIDAVVVLTTQQNLYYDSPLPINRFQVVGGCQVRMKYQGGLDLRRMSVYDEAGAIATSPFLTITSTQYIFTVPSPGSYYITVFAAIFPAYPSPFKLTLTTPCNQLCLSPGQPIPRICYSTCGDGIFQTGEQCDTGNNTGCINCQVGPGYRCYGNLGGTSTCVKDVVCGDGVVDAGEECDNGGKVGCSGDCRVDAGYKCSAVIGQVSICGFCGNKVIEFGEECDNGNALGCSVGCKIDPGFGCQGTITSLCFRRNPVCGNGIGEIGESCDDGNLLAGDGCGRTCLVQSGYSCSGDLGQPSTCTKSQPTPICGNSIYQPSSGEQCDNSNKAGCINCVIQSGWKCVSQVGLASSCSLEVVAQSSGNGVYEPAKGEICDDGNVVNGDGCNQFCQVQFGWICLQNKRCLNSQQILQMCGNGNLQPQLGQQCDDQNTLSGDGCSQTCKIENGWTCSILSQIQNRSHCTRQTSGSGFCGNGVVDGTEQCDDGFPLRNGDGCSVSCRIQAGWNCGMITNQQTVSKCWRIV